MRRPPPPTAPAGELLIRNRQRARRVDTARLRRVTLAALALQPGLKSYELGIHLVGAQTMAWINRTFLDHEGSTDIITFDHTETGRRAKRTGHLHGELFICVDEAVTQAREFGTTWRAELVRYVVHGILHLRGYDDRTVTARRRMKAVENRLVRRLV